MAGSSGAHRARPSHREGARVLVFDADDRLLVLRGHDPHAPERSWWFTTGGGVEPGETARQAAVRELAEETGYRCHEDELVGPVWDRTAVFDFMSQPFVQHEVFFVLRLNADADRAEIRFTEVEEETVDETAWLTNAEVAAAPIEVFPSQLREPWDHVLDWDGQLRELGVEASFDADRSAGAAG